MTKPKPICERIVDAVMEGGEDRGTVRQRDYHSTLAAVFPEKDYPRAWRYQSNGGPPGCAMAFGAALRRLGLHVDYSKSGRRMIRLNSHHIQAWRVMRSLP